MALATLSIDLVAQLASLQEGMDKAGRLAERQANEIEARYARLTEGARAFGAAIGGAISVAGLAAFFRTTVNGLDALNDLKDATGSSIENISALEDIAARTGTSFETVASGLVKFNKVLNEAEPDSKMERTLRAIGLSAEELRGLDPSQALLKTALALDGYADSGSKARLMLELFGKSTKEFAPFLKDLAEAGELNAKVTTKQAEEAEKFNKQMSALAKNSADTARAIVGDLLPAINGLFDSLNKTPTRGRSFIAEMVSEIQSLRLSALVTDIEAMTGQLSRATPGSDSAKQLATMLAAARKEYEGLSRAAADANEKLKASLPAPPGDAGAGRGFINPPMVKPAAPVIPDRATAAPKAEKEKIDEADRALQSYIKSLQHELVTVQQLSTVEEARQKLSGLGKFGESVVVNEVVMGLASEIDLRKQGLEFAKAMTAEMERQTKEQESLDTELARFAGRIEDARKQALTARLESRLAAGETFTPEELKKILEAISGIKTQVSQLDVFTKQFATNIQSAFGDTLEQALSGNFSNIGKLWSSMLIKMASQAVAADLTRTLFPNVLGGAGSGVSSVGSITGMIGSFIGGIFGGGRALGGGVGAGGMYQVVEKGPELLQVGNRTMLLMGKQGGQVTPAAVPAAGGTAPAAAAISINVAAGPTRGEVLAAVQMAVSASEQRMIGMLMARRVIT